LLLETLARVSCISPYHFHRIFTSLIGETPDDYISRLRIERAISMMESNPRRPLADIALSNGFVTTSLFNRSFKNYFRISPRSFRMLRREQRNAILEKSKNRRLLKNQKTDTDEQTDGHDRICVKYCEPLRVAYVRHIGNYDFRIGLAWARLIRWAKKNRYLNADTEMISVSNDALELTLKGRRRYDACLTVSATVVPRGRIGVMVLPAGLYAIFLFNGRKGELDSFYDHIFRDILPHSGYDIGEGETYRILRETAAERRKGIFINEFRVPVIRLSRA
jgi:AraC family transcriptional regulator